MAATKERRRTRINSKIEQLPPDVKSQVDMMLADSSNTYEDIAQWLKAQDYDISRGSVGRYALRANQAAQRVAENLQKTRAILEMMERNPEMDAAKASQALMMDGLMQRLSTAEEEYLNMPLEDAGRLLASFRRVDIADKKLKLETRKKIDLAFEALEEKMLNIVKANPELSAKMRDLLIEAKEEILRDDAACR